jgi:hypothetical protein
MDKNTLVKTNQLTCSPPVKRCVIKRIYLHPGYVISNFDGNKHFIGSRQLAELYKVDLSKCYLVPYGRPFRGHRNNKDEIHLYPRNNGIYQDKAL